MTTLSQQYFHIRPGLNLLCVPLTEGRFLLHLPDLYHELAHPLLVEQDDPIVEPIQVCSPPQSTMPSNMLPGSWRKRTGVEDPNSRRFMLRRWEIAWVKYWMVEFFCDLFAVYTLGPAFAWAHLHLTAKRGEDPFHVPIMMHLVPSGR